MSANTIQAPARQITLVPLEADPTLATLLVGGLLKSNDLQPQERQFLRDAIAEPTKLSFLTKHIKTIWVDTSGLRTIISSTEQKAWNEQALRYLIVRQAPFRLLERLFHVNRRDLREIRDELCLNKLTARARQVADADLDRIYSAWREVLVSYSDEASRWVEMADRFNSYPVASLYTVCVLDGAPMQVAAGRFLVTGPRERVHGN